MYKVLFFVCFVGQFCAALSSPAAAAIRQRTADTAALGSCSSRHTGSLPSRCVRPPSGQNKQSDPQTTCATTKGCCYFLKTGLSGVWCAHIQLQLSLFSVLPFFAKRFDVLLEASTQSGRLPEVGSAAGSRNRHSPCGQPPCCYTPALLPQTRPGCPLSAGPAWSRTAGARWWTRPDGPESAERGGKRLWTGCFLKGLLELLIDSEGTCWIRITWASSVRNPGLSEGGGF